MEAQRAAAEAAARMAATEARDQERAGNTVTYCLADPREAAAGTVAAADPIPPTTPYPAPAKGAPKCPKERAADVARAQHVTDKMPTTE